MRNVTRNIFLLLDGSLSSLEVKMYLPVFSRRVPYVCTYLVPDSMVYTAACCSTHFHNILVKCTQLTLRKRFMCTCTLSAHCCILDNHLKITLPHTHLVKSLMKIEVKWDDWYLGYDSALTSYIRPGTTWANEILFNEPCPWCRIAHSTWWPAVQCATTMLRMPPSFMELNLLLKIELLVLYLYTVCAISGCLLTGYDCITFKIYRVSVV